jgi:mitochondrial fission protein ELM1
MLTVWVLTDGKRGHENQSLGLAEALARKTKTRIVTIPVSHTLDWLGNWLLGRFPGGQNHPRPDLIIAAGHSTHYSLLAARRAFGGKTVVLMKPTLPLSWFDLVVLPSHDRQKPRPNRLFSEGPLNRIQPNNELPRTTNLILIGGPSPHFKWDSKRIVDQIRELVQYDPAKPWSLTTSRRTPANILSMLDSSLTSNLNVVPHERTAPDWLPGMLAQSHTVWVTPDSASMAYEALTTGARVGLLELQSRQTRVARSLLRLGKQRLVTPFSQWQRQHEIPLPATHFNEADRIADEILKWMKRN